MKQPERGMLVVALCLAMSGCRADSPPPLVFGGGESVNDVPGIAPTENSIAIGIPERPASLPPADLDGPQPPPLLGGGLLVLQDDDTLVASDADRDAVWIASASSAFEPAEIQLPAGSMPWRLVEAREPGVVYVSLRGTGAVARIDAGTASLEEQVAVCPAPRGLDVDPEARAGAGSLWVACAGGQLVELALEDHSVVQRVEIEPDARDVVVMPQGIFVSHFRNGKISALSLTGELQSVHLLRELTGLAREPAVVGSAMRVLWRMRKLNDTKLVIAHQLASTEPVVIRGLMSPPPPPGDEDVPEEPPPPGFGREGYGSSGGCSAPGLVKTAMSIVSFHPSDGSFVEADSRTDCLPGPTLPIDAAVSAYPDPLEFALASGLFQPPAEIDGGFEMGPSPENTFAFDGNALVVRLDPLRQLVRQTLLPQADAASAAHITALAYLSERRLVALTREPTRLELIGTGGTRRVIAALAGAPGEGNLGRRLFHTDTGSGIACASCHPEGLDDGHVWHFQEFQADGHLGRDFRRRTQTLAGGMVAPLHWNGEFEGMDQLTTEVFGNRMGGFALQRQDVEAMGHWLRSLSAPKGAAPEDEAAVARGQELFHDQKVGCSGCHGGRAGALFDVGTGGMFKAPTLTGVVRRGPYMHTGCAETLEERLTDPSCGGALHGNVGHLGSQQLQDLVAYLETL